MEKRLQKYVEPARLATRGGDLEGALPGNAISRLGELYRSRHDVAVRLHFERSKRGRILVTGTIGTELDASCQRCLEPVSINIAQEISVELVDLDTIGAEQGGGFDEFDDAVEFRGKLNLHELIEDELVLACPIVPQHAIGECSKPPGEEDEATLSTNQTEESQNQESQAAQTRKPFADLADLMAESEKNS